MNQEVQRISKDEVRAAMKMMKSAKELVQMTLPLEAWRCLGEMAVKFNRPGCLIESERTP